MFTTNFVNINTFDEPPSLIATAGKNPAREPYRKKPDRSRASA